MSSIAELPNGLQVWECTPATKVVNSATSLCSTSGLTTPSSFTPAIVPLHACSASSSGSIMCQTREALVQDVDELQRLDEDVDTLHAEINRARALIEDLQQKRSALQKRIALRKASVSQLRTFPVELLQEIFRHCRPSGRYNRPHPSQAPLLLGQVCRRWRVVAHATSELWASISLIDLGFWTSELYIFMIEEWLRRSRSRPLEISIVSGAHARRDSLHCSPPSELAQLLRAHSSRFFDISLSATRSYIHFLIGDAQPLPLLHSLDLSLYYDDGVPSQSNITLAPAACNLRRVKLAGIGHAEITSQAIFSRITHLTLTLCASYDLVNILHHCTDLRHLVIRTQPTFRGSGAQPALGTEPQVFDKLETMHVYLDDDALGFDDCVQLGRLIDSLSFPRLRGLAIIAPKGYAVDLEAWNPLSHVLMLAGRSTCRHKQLEFRNFHTTEGTEGMFALMHSALSAAFILTNDGGQPDVDDFARA